MKITFETFTQAQKDWKDFNEYIEALKETNVSSIREIPKSFKEMFGYEIIIFTNDSMILSGERYSDKLTGLLYKKGDRVKLPFGETGTVVNGKEYAWMKVYRVRIRRAVFNKTNERIEFFERQLNYE